MAKKYREISDDDWVIRYYDEKAEILHPDLYDFIKELQKDEKKLVEFVRSHPDFKSDTRGRPSNKPSKYTHPEYRKFVKDVEDLVQKGKAKDKKKACEILFKEGKYPHQESKTNSEGLYILYKNTDDYLLKNHYYDDFPPE